MSDQFHKVAAAVAARFKEMSKGELFTVDIEGDALYEAYQQAFPEGTNPMFRKAREHECSTCRNFIKNLGNVVSIVNGKMVTVWADHASAPAPYNVVMGGMNALISALPINGIYRTHEPKYGAEKTIEPASAENGGKQIVWHHYSGRIVAKHFVQKNAAKSAAALIGEANATAQVFKRGMEEITRDAIETVHGLITTKGALYRADEFAFNFGKFVGMHSKYRELKSDLEKNLFIWANLNEPATRLRNTAFGTLLIDLSSGMDIESAVKRYETVMAPANYKRPTALITPRMVEDAMKTINELDIEPALHRRLANASDLSVNNVLFVDNAVRGKMRGGVANLLAEAAVASTPSHKTKSIPEIGIDDFMKNILPGAKTMEIMVSNAHQGNFMTLTAPQYADAKNLFKWDNAFGWSYDGNITDSIKERVKAAGGSVDGALRVSLAWFNHDDLDLHLVETNGRGAKYEIYFGNRSRKSPMGGMLDVDMNAGRGTTREPVENITYDRLTDGDYRVVVHNYSKRETTNPGFTLELAIGNMVQHFSAKSSPSSGGENHAIQFSIKNGQLSELTMGAGIEGRAFSQEKWGVKTEQFTRVDTMLLSPNHWDGNSTGNKHYLFVLDGCKTDVPTRGIYNEFLKPEYDKHRKVFEVLGNKMMCDPVPDQLSGVGFSSTRNDKVLIKVNHQIYNVQF